MYFFAITIDDILLSPASNSPLLIYRCHPLVVQILGKESACSAGDPGSIPGWERSPGQGNGYPLQYSCLENPMDRGAWQATVHMQIQI